MSTWLIEITAAAFGVLGTVLLALNGPRAGWGFVAYLVSNAGWIGFAWIHSHWGLLAQQVAFTASSMLGAWVWLVKPPRSTSQMTNAELCEAIRLIDDLIDKELQRPMAFGVEAGPSQLQQQLATLLDIQLARACANGAQ